MSNSWMTYGGTQKLQDKNFKKMSMWNQWGYFKS